MRILITGANGLVGQKVCEQLLKDENLELIATSKSACKLPVAGPYFQLLDITDNAAVLRCVETIRPQVVINCAGITQVDQCEEDKALSWKVNVEAVGNLIAACGKVNARLVQLSTDFVFDGLTGMYTENDVPSPVNYYGVCKLEAERMIAQSLVDYAIVRTVLVYGVTAKMTRSNLVFWVKGALEKGEAIHVVDDQFRTPTLAEDLAKACIDLSCSCNNGVYHVSGNDYLSVIDFAYQVADFWGLNKGLISPISSYSLSQLGKRPARTGFKLDKINKETGYLPSSIQEGLGVVKQQLDNIGKIN
jgi:dTDP-4-dehydrorhamnose reductase